MSYGVGPKRCDHEGCKNSYVPHHHGMKKASREGWFHQKDGRSWCPDHIPSWVADWRARKSKG